MEIGSIFEIDIENFFKHNNNSLPLLPVQNGREFSAFYFNTGRSAIEAMLLKMRKKGFNELLLPSFICDSVRDAALRAGVSIRYYKINKDLSVDVASIDLSKNSILYVVQYFGQRINIDMLQFIDEAKRKGIIVVEDISLSLLSSEDEYVGFGNYIIGSLRKWFPIVDGGILLSEENEEYLVSDSTNDYTLYYFLAQILKYSYLKNTNQKAENKQIFLSYNKCGMSSLFSDYTIRRMSMLSEDLLKNIDLLEAQKKRIENYDYLFMLMKDIPQIKVLVNRKGKMTPLGMIILSDERDTLLNYLISKDIYCNVHWKENRSISICQESQYLSSRCLTIPCDQRYGMNEMKYIYDTICNFYGG